jgi:hypothetical protein
MTVAVVVAAPDGCAAAPGGFRRFAEEVRGRGEVVVVDGSPYGAAGASAVGLRGVRVLHRPGGGLVPRLWGEGLRATAAPLVAFSTSSMVPRAGWLDALLERLPGSGAAAAVGGPIVPAAGLNRTDRAVYLLRYLNYLPPLSGSASPEPPGDNALYRRDALVGWALPTFFDPEQEGGQCPPYEEGGFWEAEVNEALRARGEELAMAGGAVVTYHGGTPLGAALRQRFRHARRYGTSRGARMTGPGRLLRAAAGPVVPVVVGRRIIQGLRARGEPLGRWRAAFPRLAALLTAWAAGEALGMAAGAGMRDRVWIEAAVGQGVEV